MANSIVIDAYYDVMCNICGAHRSTDYNKGMECNKTVLRKLLKPEGWKRDSEYGNMCTECVGRVLPEPPKEEGV